MSSSHDPVTRMFHCLFIVLKISLFSMSSSHDPVIKMFHGLFIVLKITLNFSMSSSHILVTSCKGYISHTTKPDRFLYLEFFLIFLRLVFITSFQSLQLFLVLAYNLLLVNCELIQHLFTFFCQLKESYDIK